MEKIVDIKVITLGDIGVGKTCILNRIKFGKFPEYVSTTLGVDFKYVKRKYKSKNITISLKFIDTQGQEGFQNNIPKQYIRDSQIVLFVFDSIATLKSLTQRWYNIYKETTNKENSRFILVGNKSDIFGIERDEILEKGEEFAEEINAHFITCSAKCSDNMDNLERYIITEAKRFIDDEESKLKENNSSSNNNNNILFKNNNNNNNIIILSNSKNKILKNGCITKC